MKRSLTALLLCCVALVAACASTQPGQFGAEPGQPDRVEQRPGGAAAVGPPPTTKVLATGLDNPWELTWGPDDFLWVTEKSGKRVDRINPANGAKTTVLTIPEVAAGGGQHGLLGMAFGDRSLYLAYTVDLDPGEPEDLRAKIVRYAYDRTAATLRDPVDVITGLPASRDHDSGRLLVGPDRKLYYSIGDQGNNQFKRRCQPIRAQDLPTAEQVVAKDWSAYQGKTLRIEPDGSVPADNPTIRGVRSHVYSWGHRNPQGLTFGPGGRLYSAEHGPKSDDEINLIRPGKNYGWPLVAGFRDDQSYHYAIWAAAPNCAGLDYDDYVPPPSVPRGPSELQWTDPDYVEPLKTLYTVPSGHDFTDEACGENLDLCWPSIAPASLEYFPAQGAPNPVLANTLLVPSLKNGAVYVLKLEQNGEWLQGDVQQLFRTANRYRDTAVSPDRATIYVATDSKGLAGPGSGSPSGELANPGSVLAFTLTTPR